jgi:UDP-N-acetyl-D-galactosamine dehydrogenase
VNVEQVRDRKAQRITPDGGRQITSASRQNPAVVVIGLGYVGLPLAVALAGGSDKERVLGFDIDADRVAELKSGHDRTGEIAADKLRASNLDLSSDGADIIGAGIYLVTVPTPVDERNRPDLSALHSACRIVGSAIAASPRREPPIVVFESTVYPGVTEDVCGPALESSSGLHAGHDFFLGYSPERINPGDRLHTVDRIAKVVAGQTPKVAEQLAALYRRVTPEVFVARNIRTAEAAKVIENAQRDINIAFINEITMIFGRLGISIYDVLDAARTKWNFLNFTPGLVGGHCIGVDPFYLAHCAQSAGLDPEVILAGRRINDRMGDHLAACIANAYAAARKSTEPPKTLVLGLTFKENVPDLRNSKVADLIAGLTARGHIVAVHDPRADAGEALTHYGVALIERFDDGTRYDCVVGAVAHDEYLRLGPTDFERLLQPGGLIADSKAIWRDVEVPDGLRRWQP